MERDSIVDEVRAVRDAFAKEHGYNIKAIVRALKREQVKNGRKLVRLQPKRLPRKRELRKAG